MGDPTRSRPSTAPLPASWSGAVGRRSLGELGPNPYLVSADEYHSLKETVYLLRSPRNADRLYESLAEVQAGRAEPHELVVVQARYRY